MLAFVVPDGVTVAIKKKQVTVKGPRGTLNLDLSHLPIDLSVSTKDGKQVVKRGGRPVVMV